MKKIFTFTLLSFMFLNYVYAENKTITQNSNAAPQQNNGALDFEKIVKKIQNTEKNIHWQGMQNHSPNGVSINVAMFNSQLNLLNTAQLISHQHPIFQKVLTLPNRVVLTGIYKNQHWLADINTYKNGVTGYVSSLKSLDINLDTNMDYDLNLDSDLSSDLSLD